MKQILLVKNTSNKECSQLKRNLFYIMLDWGLKLFFKIFIGFEFLFSVVSQRHDRNVTQRNTVFKECS